jgi:osmotically-inducible protein OsmY
MKTAGLGLTLLLITAGCSESMRSASTEPSTRQSVNRGDNTAVNSRDRDGGLKTPTDQNENQRDIDITAAIRKRVVDTKMSVDAQNVKIITADGMVTLRGPVKTAGEKKQVEDIAHDVAGANKVDSQLEVAQQ